MSLAESVDAFKKRLSRLLKMDLELVVNENKSTMLNLLDKTSYGARLSVHKMFLEAPDPVIGAIAHYVRGTRKERAQNNLILRSFIQEHLAGRDYTHLVDPSKLVQKGTHYDLAAIYSALNQRYFNHSLDLAITWYGRKFKAHATRITFGQYVAGLRLIKIHKRLDNPFFPDYFVSFVVYHEMLHSIIPGQSDARGRFTFHSRHFKEKERAFADYEKAILWEKKNKATLFKGLGSYGWA